jgi:hypothetical protein
MNHGRQRRHGTLEMPGATDSAPLTPGEALGFADLVAAIRQVHEHCAVQVKRTVNVSLTLRNWVIGGYIHHYELNGRDRASYGDGLVEQLAAELGRQDMAVCDRQRLYSYIAFFRAYPQVRDAIRPGTLPPLRFALGEGAAAIIRSLTGQFAVPGQVLLDRLSFTHLEAWSSFDDPFKRAFYEIECIRGNWSVRELKRQIATLYFERSGLSRDTEKLAALVAAGRAGRCNA